MFLPTDPLEGYGYGVEPTIWKPAETGITFLVQGEMHSTGKRNPIGFINRRCHLDMAIHHYFGEPWLYLYSQPFRPKQTQQAIDQLLHTSRISWELAVRDALTKIASAGLPSLGKKR